jgi:hypothetical protein
MSTTATTTTKVAASQGPTVIIVPAVFLALEVFFIGLRAVVKAKISHTFGINDVAMMVAVVRSIWCNSSLGYVADYGSS